MMILNIHKRFGALLNQCAKKKYSSETSKPVRIRRAKFKDWLANEAKLFEKPLLNKTNYLASDVPFPMNPYFKPQPPLSDLIKEEIWKGVMIEDKTVREIGTKYNISLKRIQAIVKLKNLEKDMEKEGIQLQKNFCNHMEKMLGTRISGDEKLFETVMKVGKPRFELIEEEKEITSEDAAKLLHRKSLEKRKVEQKKFEEAIDSSLKDRRSIKSENVKKQMKEICQNDEEKNKRFEFRFKDVKTMDVFIRDKDGRLYHQKKNEQSV